MLDLATLPYYPASDLGELALIVAFSWAAFGACCRRDLLDSGILSGSIGEVSLGLSRLMLPPLLPTYF